MTITCLTCGWRGTQAEMSETADGNSACPRCSLAVPSKLHERAGELATFAAAATCFNTDEFMIAMWRRIHALRDEMGEPDAVPWFAQRWAAQARAEMQAASVLKIAMEVGHG